MDKLNKLSDESQNALKHMLNELLGGDIINRIATAEQEVKEKAKELNVQIEVISKSMEQHDSKRTEQAKNVTDAIALLKAQMEQLFETFHEEMSNRIENAIKILAITKRYLVNGIYSNTRAELNSTRRNGIKRYFYNDVPALLKHSEIFLSEENLTAIWYKAEINSKKYGLIISYEVLRRNLIKELDAYFAKIDKTCHDKAISQS